MSELKTISHDNLPCIFECGDYEDVAGDGGSRMYIPDCAYDGDLDLGGATGCDKSCPAYQAPEIKVCQKHSREYYGDCCCECDAESYEDYK